MKRAVILLNLGGPLAEEDIRPYLFNFFMDKNIIAAPLPVRYVLARFISESRSKGAAREAYSRLGFKSPLLENTRVQAAALEKEMRDTRVFTAMRYWHPFAKDVAREVKAYDPDEIVLLPLYPQYSTATTKSALEDWDRAAKTANLVKPTRKIRCWPLLEEFIEASAQNIRAVLETAPGNTRLLLSAHGLPEKVVKSGDPYQWQCGQTARAIAEKLAIPGLDWQICYQSRVGPLKWIGPSTSEALHRAAADRKNVVVYPHAFVSEHVETLVEIDIEYREQARALGIPWFARAAATGTHPLFIRGLARLAAGEEEKAACPAPFARCGCR